MTLEDIENVPKEMLLMEDIAPFLGMNPQSLRSQAQSNPHKLGFPVVVCGTRVRVPKKAFVFWCRYGYAIIGKTFEE